MNKVLIKLSAILIYITALLCLVKFKFFLLFDFKIMGMVFFGTCLLTIAGYSKGMGRKKIREKARWNASISGYMASFILIFSQLSSSKTYDNILYDMALNLRPLLYGLILQVLLNEEEKEEKGEKIEIREKICNIEKAEVPLKVDLIVKMKEEGLTEREIEIAQAIYENLSNKEIGDKLFITESTVKKHTSNLYKKLKVQNREQVKQWIKSNRHPD
ncbi:MAG: LuxR C-terminal-related transcriptional regulator [Acetivibrio sp.]